jgi:Ca2+/Na+ antiporter
MIKHTPDAAQVPGLLRPDPPASLLGAVVVMYAGALACAAHVVVYVMTASAEKAAIAARYPHLTAHHLATLGHVAVIVGAVLDVIGAVLFAWVARSSGKGKNGARVLGTVLFAIAILGTAYNFVSPVTALNRIFDIGECLIGLTAVVLLWQRAASAWFAYFKRPQF